VKARASPVRRARQSTAGGLRLDPRVRQALQCLARVLARCGCAPRALEREFAKVCREIPKSLWKATFSREPGAPAHVLTLWFSDPAYLDARGGPRPLPLRGRTSIEALAHRVDPSLDARDVLRYLQRGRGLRRTGGRYVPRDRVLNFAERLEQLERLRGLFGLLSTLKHNSERVPQAARRFDVFAWNPHFPVSARPAFDKHVRRVGNRFLVQFDTQMHLRELARRPGEPTIPLGVGVYVFEDNPVPPTRGTHRGRRARK
jgi:hypothetical protein